MYPRTRTHLDALMSLRRDKSILPYTHRTQTHLYTLVPTNVTHPSNKATKKPWTHSATHTPTSVTYPSTHLLTNTGSSAHLCTNQRDPSSHSSAHMHGPIHPLKYPQAWTHPTTEVPTNTDPPGHSSTHKHGPTHPPTQVPTNSDRPTHPLRYPPPSIPAHSQPSALLTRPVEVDDGVEDGGVAVEEYSVTGRTGVAGGQARGGGGGGGWGWGWRGAGGGGGGGLEELGVDVRQAGEAGVGDGAQGGQAASRAAPRPRSARCAARSRCPDPPRGHAPRPSPPAAAPPPSPPPRASRRGAAAPTCSPLDRGPLLPVATGGVTSLPLSLRDSRCSTQAPFLLHLLLHLLLLFLLLRPDCPLALRPSDCNARAAWRKSCVLCPGAGRPRQRHDGQPPLWSASRRCTLYRASLRPSRWHR